jgi:hypothetical protein
MKRFFTDLGVEVALLGVDCVRGGNLTKDNQASDGIKRSKGKFDPFQETRQ